MHLHEIIESVENNTEYELRFRIEKFRESDCDTYSMQIEADNDIAPVEVTRLYQNIATIKCFSIKSTKPFFIYVKFSRTAILIGSKMDRHVRFRLVDHEFTVKAGEKFSPEHPRFINLRTSRWQLNPELMDFPSMGIGPSVKEIADEQ